MADQLSMSDIFNYGWIYVFIVLILCFSAIFAVDKNFEFLENQQEKTSNVVIISVDALRPDRLGTYGYDRNTSPNVDSLAKESTVFTNVTSPSGSTIFAMPSIFTSRYPFKDEIVKYPKDESKGVNISWENSKSLVGKFKDKGYNTRAAVAIPFVKREFGFDKYFDQFDDNFTTGSTSCNVSNSASAYLRVKRCWEGREANETTKIGIEMIESDKPFFLWLHYSDTHSPYMPPEKKYLGRFKDPYNGENISRKYTYSDKTKQITKRQIYRLNNAYDAEVSYVDNYIGKVIQKLKDQNEYENTIIVLTADHGECLGERKHIDHNRLYRCSLKVPLIVKVPGKDSNRINSPVSTIDIFPTLVEENGWDLEKLTRGENLFSETHRDYQYAEQGKESKIFSYDSNVSIGNLNQTSESVERSSSVSDELKENLRDLGYTDDSLTSG